MSLLDRLNSPDDYTRLRAAEDAAADGGPQLVDVLLDLALHDPTEVQTTGGMAEVWRNVSDAAAQSLKVILARRNGLDDRIRRASFDLAEDDERVSRLLYYLGERYEPVRRELETSSEERLRVRALKAVLSYKRPAGLNRRFLADPSPLVRVEALQGGAGFSLTDLERPLTDPSPRVRLAAAKKLRWAKDSEAFVAAARVETDRQVRQAFVEGLTDRPLTEAVRHALIGYLADDDGDTGQKAAARLKLADDPGVGAAIASRILVQDDERQLATLVEYHHLLKYAPELRDLLEHVHRCTPDGWLRQVLSEVLRAERVAYGDDDPVDGLDAVRQARLLREVLGWARGALEPDAGPDALGGLRAWLAAPDDRTANEWITEHDWFGTGVVAELLHAAVDGDLRRALAVEVRPGRAAAVARLAHLFTARQIRAGVSPLPPGRLSPMLTHGPNALRVRFYRGAPAVLGLRQSSPVESVFRPEHAVLHVPCPGCGTPVRAEGPVEWRYRDDDRLAESEDGFAGTLVGTCPTCGAAARAEALLSVTESRFDRSREITWDAVS
jgi:HEAT repeat protein